MGEIALGDKSFVKFDLTASAMEPVVFAGPCIAIAQIKGGSEIADNGWIKTSIVTGYIGPDEAASTGAIEYGNTVDHNSSGPSSLTISIPTGHQGRFVISGGAPALFTVTLVRP